MTPRRIEFRVAVLRQGRKMYDVARDLGVSYNHLVLVLDGKRKPSARLEAGIDQILNVDAAGMRAYAEVAARYRNALADLARR